MSVPGSLLRLFGCPGIGSEDVVAANVALWRHPLALAAILAAEANGTVTRDKLAALLWPEADTERARNRLRVALHALRQALGQEAIVSVADGLRLDTTRVRCDVVDFRSALEAGQPELAVQAYGGPFLDGFHLPDSLEFDQWAEAQRDRLARLYRGALEQMAEASAAAGELSVAVEWWRKRVVEEPGNGRLVVHLMEALERAGDAAGALREAERHARVLREEFDTDPSPEVHALGERIRAGRGPTKAPPHPAMPGGDAETGQATGNETVPGGTDGAGRLDAQNARRTPGEADGERVRQALTYVATAATIVLVLGSLTRMYSWAPLTLRVSIALFAVGWLFVIAPHKRDQRRWRSPEYKLVLPGILLLVVLVGGWIAAGTAGRSAATPGEDRRLRIAALPCNQIPPDPATEYLAVGIADQVIGELSRSASLKPIALTSVLRYRTPARDVATIASELKVGTILDCTLRQQGERIRVTFHLIDAAGTQIWAVPYVVDIRDVIGAEHTLALRIAQALDVRLEPSVGSSKWSSHTASEQAWLEYLRGRHLTRNTRRDLDRAIHHFEQAIRADPNFALAHAGLADAVRSLGVFGVWPPREARDSARAAARRALNLDDGLAEGHAAIAAIRFWFDWDWAAADEGFTRARHLQPSSLPSRQVYASFLIAMRRFPEAFELLQQNIDLDPQNPFAHDVLAWAYYMAGEYDRALVQLQRTRNLFPEVRGLLLAWVYAAKGMFPEALAAADSAERELSEDDLWLRTSLAAVRGVAGRREDAQLMLNELRQLQQDRHVDPRNLAVLYGTLGDSARALDELERAHALGSPEMVWLNLNRSGPFNRGFRDSPRYAALVRALRFPRHSAGKRTGRRAITPRQLLAS